jgi:hypothetical protein
MNISMNGPAGPQFPHPTWVLAQQELLWSRGLPEAIRPCQCKTALGNEVALMVFAKRDDAQAFVNANQLIGTRPIAIEDALIFLALLSGFVRGGGKHVVRGGKSEFVCDAQLLLDRLSAALKSK